MLPTGLQELLSGKAKINELRISLKLYIMFIFKELILDLTSTFSKNRYFKQKHAFWKEAYMSLSD